MFYLTGICPLLLLLVPPLEIYFDLRPMNLTITPITSALYYFGFYAMQILLAWFVVGSFRWETLTLATASFPIYAKALSNVITGKDAGWHVTGSGATRSPFDFIVPQLLFRLCLAQPSVVAITRDVQNGQPTLAMAWNVTNTIILALFVGAAAREAWGPRPAASIIVATDDDAPAQRTIVARPLPAATPAPAPAPAAGSAPLACSSACHSSSVFWMG